MRLFLLFTFILLIAGTFIRADEDSYSLPLGDPDRAYILAGAAEGTFYDCRKGTKLSFEEMIEKMSEARIILMGEEHTSMDQHLFQAKVLKALKEKGVSIKLGMEFFQREDSEALAQWTAGELSVEEFLVSSGWYERGGMRFEYYLPLLETARDQKIPIAGLNIPRRIVNAVARGGIESLSDDDMEIVGDMDTENKGQHTYLVGLMFGESVADMPASWLERMETAQSVWDTVMAHSILDNLKEGESMVVIVGSGHVGYDLGIPRRLNEKFTSRGIEDIGVISFLPVVAPAPDPKEKLRGHPTSMMGMGGDTIPKAIFSRSYGDIVGVFPDRGAVEAYPSFGASFKKSDEERLKASFILPDSVFEKAGLKMGDRVVDLNGITPEDSTHLRFLFSDLNWGDRLDLKIARGEEVMNIVALLQPDIEYQRERITPGYARELLDSVTPASTVPIKAKNSEGKERRTCLISEKGTPVRVEVWLEDTLIEFHDLDSEGRIVRSLFKEPLPGSDGTPTTAVEISYERGSGGEITSKSYRDRSGVLIR